MYTYLDLIPNFHTLKFAEIGQKKLITNFFLDFHANFFFFFFLFLLVFFFVKVVIIIMKKNL